MKPAPSFDGRRFEPAHRPPDETRFPALWCAFRGNRLLVVRENGALRIPETDAGEVGADLTTSHYVGSWDGRGCYASWLPEDYVVPAGAELIALRPLILEGDETVAHVAGRAWQILEWDRTHRHCGVCGAATVPHDGDCARICPACKQLYYPRIAPVVMALVTRGRELLLTRKPGYPAGRYTVVAGFVEAGESVEHALIREVREEVGVEAANPLYFGSQPWPFPNSLVMAFSLAHVRGDVRPDGVELEDARWFDIDALPELPEAVHISRQLIEGTIARLRRTQL